MLLSAPTAIAPVVLNQIGSTAPAGGPAPKYLTAHTRPAGVTGGGWSAVWSGRPKATPPSAEARKTVRYRAALRDRDMSLLTSAGRGPAPLAAHGGSKRHRPVCRATARNASAAPLRRRGSSRGPPPSYRAAPSGGTTPAPAARGAPRGRSRRARTPAEALRGARARRVR